ncbi:putative Ufm1-specific protease-like, partial [Trifolium medium]|nr:putative Ufm1-specific protease-like [Trifolium medium]
STRYNSCMSVFSWVHLSVQLYRMMPGYIEKAYVQATEAVIAKLRDPQAVYMLETLSKTCPDQPPPAIVRGVQLDFHTDLSKTKPLAKGDEGSDASSLSCSYFSINNKAVFSMEVT